MRATILLTLLLGWGLASAQSVFFPDTRLPAQRKVLLPDEQAPRFPGCEMEEGGPGARQICAERRLAEWIYSRLAYPAEAQAKGIEGTVLVRFKVNEHGQVREVRIVQDPGGGCGEEALRLVGLMQGAGLRWVPARIDGQPIATIFNLPIAFRADGHRYGDGQALLTGGRIDLQSRNADHPPTFLGDFSLFLRRQLNYPQASSPCEIHDASVSFLVETDGSIRDIRLDPELPSAFRQETERLITLTDRQWRPARINGRPTPYRHVLVLPFRDPAGDCGSANAYYQLGLKYLELGHYDGSRDAFRRCLELIPNDVHALLGLGISEGHLGNLETACSYFTRARKMGSAEGEKLFRTYCH